MVEQCCHFIFCQISYLHTYRESIRQLLLILLLFKKTVDKKGKKVTCAGGWGCVCVFSLVCFSLFKSNTASRVFSPTVHAYALPLDAGKLLPSHISKILSISAKSPSCFACVTEGHPAIFQFISIQDSN